jgi:hypothetical protein
MPRTTLDEQADPWDAMQNWFAAIGYALYFRPVRHGDGRV